MRIPLFFVALISITTAATAAETAAVKVDRALAKWNAPGLIRSAVGVTRRETPIPCLLTDDDLDLKTPKVRILLIGGLDGSAAGVDWVLHAMRWFQTDDDAADFRARFALSAVPIANPDGWAAGKGPGNSSGGQPTQGYPPTGKAYSSPIDPEAAYLWRWIGMHAPDLVIDVRPGTVTSWGLPDNNNPKIAQLKAAFKGTTHEIAEDGLANQLPRVAACETGTIPAVELRVSPADVPHGLQTVLKHLASARLSGPSPARKALQLRQNRTARQIAGNLAVHYGHKIDRIAYIPAVALIGRLRLSQLNGDAAVVEDVEKILLPFTSGKKPALPLKPSGSNLSGHLVFSELQHLTGNRDYLKFVQHAADLGFDETGNPREAMPAHAQMSDSVFMGCPILAEAGRLTGERKYFDMCLRHLRFMIATDLRSDGLYRHSPLDETAWGRGNGFPALGLAMSLDAFPADQPERAEILRAFRDHLRALARVQDPTGMWHQIIDEPASYRELTCTSMITYAIIRGIRNGWLDSETYTPIAHRAWSALKLRIGNDGRLVDVCTGTGKQPNRRAYFDRTAILGPDPRGGAMALLVAVEMASWNASKR